MFFAFAVPLSSPGNFLKSVVLHPCCLYKADVNRPSLDKRLAFPIPYPTGKGTYLTVAIGNMV